MAVDYTDLLTKVREGLGYSSQHLDSVIKPKMLGVAGYMLNAGVSEEQLISDTGIVALTIGVSDLWNQESGKESFSPNFSNLLIQLQIKSLPAIEEV